MRRHSLWMRLGGWALLGVVFTTASPTLAGTIAAELDHNEGAVGEPFALTVTIEGAREGDPTLPEVDGLEIHQQGVSESTSWVNGQRSAQLQIGLVVIASKPGAFTIPSIKAKVDGQDVATIPLTLKVSDPAQGGSARQGQQNAQNQAQGQGNSKGKAGAQAKSGKNGAPDDPRTGGIFLERSCENLEPYVGEQVLCTIRLYHRGNLNGGQRVTPSSPEFRRFPLQGEKRDQKLVNGQAYTVIELREIVVPTKAGTQSLPPYTIDARILTWNKRRNPLNKFFDNFGGGAFNFDMNFTEEREVTLKSEATEFAVKALPQAGQPANFGGLVGAFKLTTQVSQNRVTAGNTVTITMTLEGDGIADSLGEIAPSFEALGKVYPDKPEYSEKVGDGHGIYAKRVYKYALVPSKPGDFDLGKVEVPVFNPELQQYTTLSSELGHLIVDPGKAESKALVVGQQPDVPGTKKEDVKVLGSDLVEVHRDATVTTQQTITNNIKILLISTGTIPPSLAFLFLGLQFLRRRTEGDVAGKRRSQAYKTFKHEMQAVHVQLAGGYVQEAMAATYTALRTYLGDKLNLHGKSLTAREIEDLLGKLGTKEAERQQLGQLILVLEQVDFGGRVPSLPEATELVGHLDRLVLALEVV